MKRLFFILFFIPLICISQITEKNVFHNVTSSSGASVQAVNAIAQDADGYLWFGTENGLFRFDGYDFYTFNSGNAGRNNNITRKRIFDLKTDKNNNLWIASANGLACYCKKIKRFKVYNRYFGYNEMAYDFVKNIVIDSNNNIWFDLTDRLGVLQRGTDTIISYKLIDEENAYIHSLCMDSTGIWISINEKLVFFNYETKQIRDINLRYEGLRKTDSDFIKELFVFGGKIYFGMYSGNIYSYNKDENETTEIFSSPTENSTFVTSFYADSKNNLYVLLDKYGIGVIDTMQNTLQVIENEFFTLIDNTLLTAMLEDSQHNYWFGSFRKGISFTNGYDNFYTVSNNTLHGKEFKSNIISSIHVDKEKNIWVGTDGGGLYKKENILRKFEYFDKISSNVVLSIDEDPEGNLWFGSYRNGIYKMPYKQGKIKQYRKNTREAPWIQSDDVRSCIIDKDGIYWFVNHSYGISSHNFSTGTTRIFNTRNGLSGDWTQDILCDKNNNIWVATNYGISKIPVGRDTVINYNKTTSDHSLSDNMVFCLYEDSDNNIWCGSQEGITYISAQDYSFKMMLCNENIAVKSIIEDDLGHIWLGTTNGLIHMDKGGTVLNKFIYGKNIDNNFFNRSACTKDSSGNLYFGGANGLTIFNPLYLETNESPPNLLLTDIQVNNISIYDSIASFDLLKLDSFNYTLEGLLYNQNNIIISYTAINYINTKKNTFAYRIPEQDTNWRYSNSQRKIELNALQPGSYIIQIKAANNDGVWNENILQIAIEIEEAWWNSTISKTMFFLIILIIIFSLVYVRFSAFRDANDALEEKVKAKTLDLFSTMKKLDEKNNKLTVISEELKERNTELQIANTTKNRLFSIIAHDVINPFATLLGFSKLLFDRFDRIDERKKRLYAKQIYSSSSATYNLLTNLLDWSRSQLDTIVYNPDFINIEDVLNDVTLLLSPTAEQKDINISCYIEEDITAFCDRNLITIVIRNLVSNAIKFTKEEGNVNIFISTYPDDDELVRIIIKDDGVGMSEEMVSRLFTNDRDVRSSVGTNKEKGTGLGLIICNEFVKKNNGTILCESKEGEGTSFIVILPKNK